MKQQNQTNQKMSILEFRTNLIKFLKSEFESFDFKETDKLEVNDITRYGIAVSRNSELDLSMGAVVYINHVYEQYLSGTSLEVIMGEQKDQISEVTKKFPEIPVELFSYEWARNHLQVRICDKQQNIDRLTTMVHEIHGVFAATFHVMLGDVDGVSASCAVTPALLDRWGDVDANVLSRDAFAANRDTAVLFNLEDMMGELLGCSKSTNLLQDETDGTVEGILVLTNTEKVHGAGLLLDRSIMNRIGHMFGGDFYVLPSSIHEVLLVPSCFEASMLSDMVRSVNTEQVAPHERLYDSALRYCVETGEMIPV